MAEPGRKSRRSTEARIAAIRKSNSASTPPSSRSATGQPHILVVRSGTAGSGAWDALPFGPFAPRAHRTLEIGLREWVKRQTGLDLGYVEQLYTFGDRGRHAEPGGAHTLSVGYLALTRGAGEELLGSHWSPWYAYFPWEDWREGKPDILTDEIEPRLKEWAERPPLPDEPARPLRRQERLRISFGIGGGWDEEKVLERYELLYEAGLVAEARRDGRPAADAMAGPARAWPPDGVRPSPHPRHRARAASRQAEIPPVVFELLPPEFTLYDLQKTVESISGTLLHKQNFRRLVEQGGARRGDGKRFDRDRRASRAALPLPPRSRGRAPGAGPCGSKAGRG